MKVYLININQIDNLSDDYCLNRFPNRYNKSLSFLKKEDKSRSLLAGYLLDKFLNLDENNLIYNKMNKPYLKDGPYFNISHSKDYIGLVINDFEVGLDIEQISNKHLKIANSIFNDNELDYLKLNDEHFTKMWTIKEGVMKASGKGISLPFKNINSINAINKKPIDVDGVNYYSSSAKYKDYYISVSSIIKIDDINIEEVKVY